VKNGFGRRELQRPGGGRRWPLIDARLLRALGALGLVVAAVLLATRYMAAQDEVEDTRQRDIRREERVEDRDVNRERRLQDRDIDHERRQEAEEAGRLRRPDPRGLERRTRLYQDIKRDYLQFGRDNFGRDSELRRYHVGPAPAIVESAETLDSVHRILDGFARDSTTTSM
jgi:hypothetical protein